MYIDPRIIISNGMNKTKFKKARLKYIGNSSSIFDIGQEITIRRNKDSDYVYNVRYNNKTVYSDDLILNNMEILSFEQ